jgi:sec-independent protein translocase protein TatC
MTVPSGEMPFLDHLEELRRRILRALGGVIVAFGVGLWAVERFQLVALLKAPIAPYLTGGKLTFTSPTEPLMIVFKLGFIVGLVLASPVIIYQAWAFLAPALYDRERKVLVPALIAGLVLFLVGAVVGYVFVVPQALRVFFSFQVEALQPMITYDAWFGFVLQIVLALGVSFELPLVIIILAALGLVTPAGLARFRRHAVVLSFVAGALLSPGADVLSMLMMTLPLLLLYEIGVAGATLIHRRRTALPRTAASIVAFLALSAAAPLGAQQIPRVGARAQDTTTRAPPGRQPGQALDTAQARRLGLPTAPSQSFAPEDSAYRSLLERQGYAVTKYRADSATILADERRLELVGDAMTERQGATMEADSITYEERSCALDASGDPKLFSEGQVLVGEGLRYDTCRKRGVVRDALTNFQEGSTVWFLRGDIAKDSLNNRIFAGHGEITSCDLPVPHYHFAARELKWISNTVLVARPVVLYIRDVPILWLPFIFQDLKPGRHSGILIPQFGLSDIIRTSEGYQRQIANIGYYWATNDYMDLTGRLDWFSRRFVSVGLQMNYRWLGRFLSGTLAGDQVWQSGGGRTTSFRWDHQQRFNLSTSLNMSLGYVTDTRVINDNAIDPLLNTQNINSQLNLNKRFRWGTVTIGGNRRQSISDGSYTQLLPALTIVPRPVAIGSNSTWSPQFRATRDEAIDQLAGVVRFVGPDGTIDSVDARRDRRTTSARLDTPFRFGSFNWANAVSLSDQTVSGVDTVFIRLPNQDTPDPADSVDVIRVVAGDFRSEFNWDTGINLPFIFRGTWKIQPTIGVTNVTGGPFAFRNRNTDGGWVVQGKRAQFSLSMTPTFFAFFNVGFLPGLSRVRHSINPLLSFSYAPSATVPRAYAEAITESGSTPELRSPAQQQLTLALNQNFEAKARPAPEDTLGIQARKFRLLSIQTSPFSYDFERAKQPGQTGWITQTVTNSLLSDLLPGFSLSFRTDLWRGTAGTDTAKLSLFVDNLNANFSVSSATVRSMLGGLGIGSRNPPSTGTPSSLLNQPNRDDNVQNQGSRPIRPNSMLQNAPMSLYGSRRGFNSTFSFTLQRFRESNYALPGLKPPEQINLQYTMDFSPTQFWALSWTAQYNFTLGRFESQSVRLERELHEWRAGFSFVKNANGNVAFFFSVFLTDLPDLRYDYQQTTFEQ